MGVLAIHASPLSAGSLEARLQTAAENALRSVDADRWATVTLNGQVATLTGLAPDRRAQEEALRVIASASWAGGQVAGGVTQVIDQTRLARDAAPGPLERRFGRRAGPDQRVGAGRRDDGADRERWRAGCFPAAQTSSCSLRLAPRRKGLKMLFVWSSRSWRGWIRARRGFPASASS
jgi:hypothetical protein